jgi:hypothetical protein
MGIYPVGSIIHFFGQNPLSFLASKVFTPKTNLFHAAIIGHYIKDEEDYEIIESLGRGITLGRLSFYNNTKYLVYWPSKVNTAIGDDLWILSSKFGRTKYDFLFYLEVAISVLKISIRNLIKFHKLKAISPQELKTGTNKDFICTRFTREFWNQYQKNILFPEEWSPIPSAYILAVQKNYLTLIGNHSKNTSISRGYIK